MPTVDLPDPATLVTIMRGGTSLPCAVLIEPSMRIRHVDVWLDRSGAVSRKGRVEAQLHFHGLAAVAGEVERLDGAVDGICMAD